MAAPLEVIPVSAGFPPDYAAGHFVLIGATGSGKTYYAKYIVKEIAASMRARGRLAEDGEAPVYVFTGGISAHDWTGPETGGEALVPPPHVFTSWNDDTHRVLLAGVSHAECGFVVFDDFKEALNFHSDKRFKQMFRAMRHLGVQLMAIGHTPNDVPPVVRDNVTHAVLFFTSNQDAIRELAAVYLSGDYGAIRDAMRTMRGHAVLKINTRLNTRAIHTAPPPHESGVSTSAVGLGPPADQALFAVGGQQEGARLGGVGLSGRHISVSGGAYHDASHNTQYLQLNQNIEAQIRQNQVTYADIRTRASINREIDEERVRHKARLSMLEEREELKGLLLTPWLSGADRDRAALLLARALGDSQVTPYNLFTRGRDAAFMTAYYPGIAYQPRDEASAAVSTYAPLAIAAASGDRGGVVGEAFKAFAPTVAKTVKTSLGPPALTARTASDNARAAARERARRLIITRPNRRQGWHMPPAAREDILAAIRPTLRAPAEADSSNVIEIALDLLKEYFPQDFEDERDMARARQNAKPSAPPSRSHSRDSPRPPPPHCQDLACAAV